MAIKFKIVRKIGMLSENSKNRLEFNLISWNNFDPKYDLRKWAVEDDKPLKGITLTNSQLEKVYNALLSGVGKQIKNSTQALFVYKNGNATASIYEKFGKYDEKNDMTGFVTYTSWGSNSPKYDIRTWNDDYTVCGKGITLSETEASALLTFIEEELDIQTTDVDYDSLDTSGLDEDLLI